MTYNITVNENRIIPACEGKTLLEALRAFELAPDSPCGGQGRCGKCIVEVDGESRRACSVIVDRNMSVKVSPSRQNTYVCSKKPQRDAFGTDLLAAIDLGTTTVVCSILSAKTGEVLSRSSAANPQRSFGADVISRIRADLAGEGAVMTSLIRDTVAGLITDSCAETGAAPESIKRVSLVANPCMQQLFMGISTANLAAIPFLPVITAAERLAAAEYLPCCPEAELLLVPDISGYVGSDMLACIMSTKLCEHYDTALIIDIGTNCELALISNDRIAVCSTAAGPALEGAGIRFGMRAENGAINRAYVSDGGIVCKVIGGGTAAGICGSGLIDCAAAALELGLFNSRGRIVDTAIKEGDRFIPLTGDIFLTQEDIHALQLAKGAVFCGIELLSEYLGTSPEKIDEVFLAGAFGSSLSPESAARIGLIPQILLSRTRSVGNAAAAGAELLVSDRGAFDECGRIAAKIEPVELAALPSFSRAYGRSLYFN